MDKKYSKFVKKSYKRFMKSTARYFDKQSQYISFEDMYDEQSTREKILLSLADFNTVFLNNSDFIFAAFGDFLTANKDKLNYSSENVKGINMLFQIATELTSHQQDIDKWVEQLSYEKEIFKKACIVGMDSSTFFHDKKKKSLKYKVQEKPANHSKRQQNT
jgi:hypothetical protein